MHYINDCPHKEYVCACVCLTRYEVKAFLVLHTGFNLTGEQVESGRGFVRLREREERA